MFEPEVFQVLLILLELCGALNDSAPGELCPSRTPSLRPWSLRAATRLKQIMVLSSNQRLAGTFHFREGKFSICPNFCATVRKTNRKVLQGDDSAQATCPNGSGSFFLNFFNLSRIFAPTSYAYSFNAETLAKPAIYSLVDWIIVFTRL